MRQEKSVALPLRRVFKQRVMQMECHCRITDVRRSNHLIASHCKPWRDAANEERLNGGNGLLLTPGVDDLFDRGFIGFEIPVN
jgi:HNH endonuclease